MEAKALAEVVFRTLTSIAPEVEPETLKRGVPLREQVDLDSIDWLNFLVGLDKELGIDIPETDYRKLVTLDDLLAYLEERVR
jgi:acyl carrier protein